MDESGKSVENICLCRLKKIGRSKQWKFIYNRRFTMVETKIDDFNCKK